MATFKAEAGKVYKNSATGAQASFTADQLKDPAAGMLSSDFQEYTTGQTPLAQTGMNQSPSQITDVAGQGVSKFGFSTPTTYQTSSGQTSPSAQPKDVGVITSIDAGQKVADTTQAANAGLSQLEQDQSRLEKQYAEKAAKQQKLMNEEAALKSVLGSVDATDLANKNAEEQRTQKTAAFKLGQAGTYYQENAADKAKQSYEGQVYRLNLQDQILQKQISQAYDNNNVNLAKELQDKKDALVKNARQVQDDAFNRMIKMTDLDSKLSKDADTAFEQIAKSGTALDEQDMSLLEQKYNLPEGMGAIKLKANQQEVNRQTVKDVNEARKADLDIANTITTLLGKVPAGQPVTIGGHEYVGLDKGDVSTGVQTNSLTGESTLWSYNKLTGDVKTTSLGTIGTAKDGWETKFDDSGNPWRFNATTGQMLPFSATPAQQDFQQIIPEGSVSPFKDANGNPRVQCGAWVNDCTGIGVGDSYESKMAKMDIWKKGEGSDAESIIDKIQVGDVFTQKLNTWTGHNGMVLGVQKGPNGVIGIIASESNYPNPGKVSSSRFIPLSEIDGFGKGKYLNPILKSGPDTARFGAEPTAVAGTPAPIGPQQVTLPRPTGPTFGAKKTEELKPMSITDLEKVNAGLPDGKKLQPGATLEDAKNSGYAPQAPTKPPTVDESKNAGFALRVKEAMDIFSNLENDISKVSTTKQLIQRNLPDIAKSSLFQQQEQAERNFINSILRRESGAAISPSEFDNARKQYFPQPGDSPEVLAQKKANRTTSLQGLIIGSGSALSEDFKNSTKETSTARNSSTNKTVSAKLLDIMNTSPDLKAKILAARNEKYTDEEIAAKLGIK
jgi:hypothetical protein